MKAIRELDSIQCRALRKRITNDTAKMARIKDLIANIILGLTNLDTHRNYFRNYDLKALSKEIFDDNPNGLSMRAKNIATFQWLFGFKLQCRIYIDCSDSAVKNHGKPPITAYHIYCIYLVLKKTMLAQDRACPIQIDQNLYFDADEVIKFLVQSLFIITSHLSHLSQKFDLIKIKNDNQINSTNSIEYTFTADRKKLEINTKIKNQIFYNIPPLIKPFVGRSELLKNIQVWLSDCGRDNDNIAVIYGMPGTGKTSMAAEIAHRAKGHFFGVCWCRAGSREVLTKSLTEFAKFLGEGPAAYVNDEQSAINLLQKISNSHDRWLLIYDDVPNQNTLEKYIPGKSVKLIITSRFPDWTEYKRKENLDVLSLNDSVFLLQEVASRVDLEGAQRLAIELGNLPLALVQAAVTCRRNLMSFNLYTQKVANLIRNAPSGLPYPKAVFATFETIMDDLSDHTSARDLLFLIVQFDPEPIPCALFDNWHEDNVDFDAALLILIECTLVKIKEDLSFNRIIELHKLVHLVARAKASECSSAESFACRIDAQIHTGWIDMRAKKYYPIECYIKLSEHVLHLHGRLENEKNGRSFIQKSLLNCGMDMIFVRSFKLGREMVEQSRRLLIEDASDFSEIWTMLERNWREVIRPQSLRQNLQEHLSDNDVCFLEWCRLVDWNLAHVYYKQVVRGEIREAPIYALKTLNRYINARVIEGGLTAENIYAVFCFVSDKYKEFGLGCEEADFYSAIKKLFMPLATDEDFRKEVYQFKNADEFPSFDECS